MNPCAEPEFVVEMRCFARRESFGEWPVPELNSEALDFRVTAESLAEKKKAEACRYILLLRDLVEAGFFKALTADDIAVLFSLQHSDS